MRALAVALVVASALAVVTAAAGPAGPATVPGADVDAADWELFHGYATKFSRVYDGVEEKLSRFRVFQANMREAERLTRLHNGEATFGVTRFSDLTADEFRARFGSLNSTAAHEQIARGKRAGSVSLWHETEEGRAALSAGATPTKVDWNAQGKVTPVRDQGDCGCCWAFTATAEYEAQILVKGYATAPTLILSPQQLVDCDTSNSACAGGFYSNAWQYIYNTGGVMQEPTYPYEDGHGSCRFSASNKYNVKPANGGSTTPGTSPTAIYAYVASHGPAAAAIDSTPLQHYTGGVLSLAQNLCPNLNHAVLITGYDSTQAYYRVKNSWNENWGEDGYFRVKATSCGISSLVYGSTGF